MNDYFALLGEPRRPWLDSEPLKAKFLELAAAVHPDHIHHASDTDKQAANRRYAELNAAYLCLREPKERLGHLLELERGRKPGGVEAVPAETMELFMQVGALCRGADAFLAGRAGTDSPLLKAQRFERALAWTDQLNALLRSLQARQAQLEADLKTMNAAWETAPPPGLDHRHRAASLPLDSLEEIYRKLSFLTRWTAQLQERLVQLSF